MTNNRVEHEKHVSILSNSERTEFINKLDLVDTAPEEAFDRLTRLASKLLDVPVSLVTIVEENRQFFKSVMGLAEPWKSKRQTPLSHSFCQYVVTSGKMLIVEDAREDPHLKDNLAIPDLDIISYLGVPLRLKNGQIPGAFCAIDSKPRKWSDEDIHIMRELTQSVITEIELRYQIVELKEERQKRELLIQELQTSEETLSQNESYLNSIINLQSVLILRTDMAGNYTYINEAMFNLYVWMYETREEMLGASGLDTILEEDHAKTMETVQACIENPGKSYQIVIRKPDRDGSFFWGLWEFVASTNAAGEVTEIQCVGIDLTEQKLAEKQAFELALERERIEILSRFIRIASHEFRTPLSIISLNANLMSRINDSEKRAIKAQNVNRQIELIIKLLEDLNLIIQIETKTHFDLQVINLNQPVQFVYDKMGLQHNPQLTVDFHLQADLPQTRGNTQYLCEILERILDNAIKFTPEGGHINIRTGFGDNEVWVEISDSGEGIKEHHINDIFELFWREDKAQTTPGFGIGLSVAKMLVDEHHGHISVEVSEMGGACLRVSLPLANPLQLEGS